MPTVLFEHVILNKLYMDRNICYVHMHSRFASNNLSRGTREIVSCIQKLNKFDLSSTLPCWLIVVQRHYGTTENANKLT